MAHLIDKDALVAEIVKMLQEEYPCDNSEQTTGYHCALYELQDFLNTLEVKDVNIWHLQEKENIYDAVKDWSLHTFACVMKDGTIQKFTGNMDEDYEGHINVHIDGNNDDYDDVDDIVKWIEIM